MLRGWSTPWKSQWKLEPFFSRGEWGNSPASHKKYYRVFCIIDFCFLQGEFQTVPPPPSQLNIVDAFPPCQWETPSHSRVSEPYTTHYSETWETDSTDLMSLADNENCNQTISQIPWTLQWFFWIQTSSLVQNLQIWRCKTFLTDFCMIM